MAMFLERYLNKSKPEDITYDDFISFMDLAIEEHQTLEYKPRGILVKQDGALIKTTNPKDILGFSSLAKSVASLANSEGGLLILGVKEKPEKYKGTIVKVRPGRITPLPPTVTREMIEIQLETKIQYPINGITVIPLRKSPRSKNSVYLIDVPQSKLAPHRVNELYYYQRYNFITDQMKHFQIADLFGRRTAPDLDIIELQRRPGLGEDRGYITIEPLVLNRGQAVAKYATCICSIISGPYQMRQSEWNVRKDKKSCQSSTGITSVIYPDVPNNFGYIEFQPIEGASGASLVLSFSLYAEHMAKREVIKEVQV